MRSIDIFILTVGAIVTLIWAVVSGKDGFRSNSTTIVARSIDVVATINGQIENDPPAVGAWVNKEDLLARIHDSRFDRGRLIEFESHAGYLNAEIENLEKQQTTLQSLAKDFDLRSASYSDWMIGDTRLRRDEAASQFAVAKARKRLEDEEVNRARQLFDRSLISEVEMQIEKTQAEIAGSEVSLSRAQLDRGELMLRTMSADGVFFENGDTSYWEKMSDSLTIRELDSRNSIAMLKSQLVQAQTQAEAESGRIDTSFAEEHRAPFAGKISARFVTEGTRVTAGTNLVRILDCTEPVAIIPIPDNRVSEFSVGMRVSVYPIDSEQKFSGRIEYITSGPMIGSDTSIQIQQELTLGGNRAIVSLDDGQVVGESLDSCETARVAVAVIHTSSVFAALAGWF